MRATDGTDAVHTAAISTASGPTAAPPATASLNVNTAAPAQPPILWLETKNRETDALGDPEGARTAARRRVLGETTTTATEASVATGNRIEEHLLWKLTYTPWEIEADPYALARLRTAEDELRRAEQGR